MKDCFCGCNSPVSQRSTLEPTLRGLQSPRNFSSCQAHTPSQSVKMSKVELVPWDPNSEQQVARLYDQRVSCGWHEEAVPKWKEAQLAGTKVVYWIVWAGPPIVPRA